MILLCTILKVVNGKSFSALKHQPTDDENWREGMGEHNEQHNRIIRQILDIRMTCPSGSRHVRGRCRKIL